MFKLALSAAALFATSVSALNILLTNDDSWASANARATYDALKADGHDVLLVAPAVQQSGRGGTVVWPTTNITEPGGEFGSIPVGAPYYGQDVDDPSIFYFNGTPAASVMFGLDIVVPQYWNNKSVDLVVSGPNEGYNSGPFVFTLSGTIGATYTSVERGVPAIAFSAANRTHVYYKDNTGEPNDPANLSGRLVANLVAALANGTKKGERLMPLGVGLNVNFPMFGPDSNCTEPPFTLTRITGGAVVWKVVLNDQGFPSYEEFVNDAVNVYHSGSRILPGEYLSKTECKSTVSVFSIDYDAPEKFAEPVQKALLPIAGKTKL